MGVYSWFPYLYFTKKFRGLDIWKRRLTDDQASMLSPLDRELAQVILVPEGSTVVHKKRGFAGGRVGMQVTLEGGVNAFIH